MILVTGSKGMLGQDLMAILPGDVRGADVDQFDITDPRSVERLLLTLRPDVVINAAAYTDVDGCESNRDTAFAVNGDGVRNLAETCTRLGARLVQVSTDYVFDGANSVPYLEDDPVRPLSVYGASKLAGEENCRINPGHLIVRTQWLYGRGGKNFVETMLRLGTEKKELSVVDDQVGSPTATRDLAQAIVALVAAGCHGTYHAVNAGSCSWNEFARAIFQEAGMAVTVHPMTTEQLGRPAHRPAYSVLDCGKLRRDAGFSFRGWRDALRDYLKDRG